MKKSTSGSLLVFITIIVSSCAPAYVPNVVNTPLLSNKGEVQAAVYKGLSGFDPQLSYAITDHVGLMLNGSFADRTSDSTDDYHKHQFVEIGSGYYTKIGTKGRFETFGGFGYGKLQAYWESGILEPYADVKSIRFFVQPTIGVTTKIFDGGLSWRFVLIDMYQGSANSTGIFAEPVLTGKLGFKYVKFITQFGFTIPLNFEYIDFSYEPFIFSVGLQATIGKKYEK
jgi:hypothetical protein